LLLQRRLRYQPPQARVLLFQKVAGYVKCPSTSPARSAPASLDGWCSPPAPGTPGLRCPRAKNRETESALCFLHRNADRIAGSGATEHG
jgi:hypothetical protein